MARPDHYCIGGSGLIDKNENPTLYSARSRDACVLGPRRRLGSRRVLNDEATMQLRLWRRSGGVLTYKMYDQSEP